MAGGPGAVCAKETPAGFGRHEIVGATGCCLYGENIIVSAVSELFPKICTDLHQEFLPDIFENRH
jgi:hypothetical protein